jgi:hypothetical protein
MKSYAKTLIQNRAAYGTDLNDFLPELLRTGSDRAKKGLNFVGSY